MVLGLVVGRGSYVQPWFSMNFPCGAARAPSTPGCRPAGDRPPKVLRSHQRKFTVLVAMASPTEVHSISRHSYRAISPPNHGCTPRGHMTYLVHEGAGGRLEGVYVVAPVAIAEIHVLGVRRSREPYIRTGDVCLGTLARLPKAPNSSRGSYRLGCRAPCHPCSGRSCWGTYQARKSRFVQRSHS